MLVLRQDKNRSYDIGYGVKDLAHKTVFLASPLQLSHFTVDGPLTEIKKPIDVGNELMSPHDNANPHANKSAGK